MMRSNPAASHASSPQKDPAPDRIPSFEVAGTHIHMIGIGGCGMSALARLLRTRGAVVTGSDLAPTPTTDALRAEGVPVEFDQAAGRLPEECALVIASAAVRPDHAELLAAQRVGIPAMHYPEALGKTMLGRTGVAIAGTHGKSTTCAMLGVALSSAGLDPTVIVGATCAQLSPDGARPTGFRLGAEVIPIGPLAGAPGIILAEACEFNRSFHNLHPTIGTITSVEADHLDIYGSLDAVVESFREFARLLPPADQGGRLLIAHEGAHRREVTGGLSCDVQTIGFTPDADWQVRHDPVTGRTSLSHEGHQIAAWRLDMPGAHMAMNSATACTLAIWLGADPTKLAEALSSFRGLDRRMQFLGEKKLMATPEEPGVRVYDDYGHHPTEIDATLRALRDHERPHERGGRLICVFQPHQHSRTRFLLDEFAQSFQQADVVIVPHIYFVRDSEIEKTKVSASDLVDRLRNRGVHAMHLYPFEAIVEQLQNVCRPNDLLVVMGAGPVWKIAHAFMRTGEDV